MGWLVGSNGYWPCSTGGTLNAPKGMWTWEIKEDSDDGLGPTRLHLDLENL